MSLTDFVSYYIIHYEGIILSIWTIVVFLYFFLRYNLYKRKEFYIFTFILIFGFYLFLLFFPNNYVTIWKQRNRYTDIAYNFINHGIFGHYSLNGYVYDILPAFSSIPLAFSDLLFGNISLYKFTLWYEIFSVILSFYLFYKIYKKEDKKIVYIALILFIFPYIYYQFLNPYNYPEFSNLLIFSFFLYLIYKKDKYAFLLLPLLLASGHEYYFFILSMPFIFYSLDKKEYIKDTLFFILISLLISFPYFYITIYLRIIQESSYFFESIHYFNTFYMILKEPYSYFPFISFFFVSIYLLIKSIKNKRIEDSVFSFFYLLFIIVLSGWGPSSLDYLYEHYLPNLIPLILYLPREIKKEVIFALSAISLIILFIYHPLPVFLSFVSSDNLYYLLKFYSYLKEIPNNSTFVFPRGYDYRYISILGFQVKYYTFMNLNKEVLNNTYYFITNVYTEQMSAYSLQEIHIDLLKLCKLIYRKGIWEIYKCKGYNSQLLEDLYLYSHQNFG